MNEDRKVITARSRGDLWAALIKENGWKAEPPPAPSFAQRIKDNYTVEVDYARNLWVATPC